MIQLTVAEVQARIPEVLARVNFGDTVEIHPDSDELYLLVTMPKQVRGAAAWPGYPKAGSLEGKIWMSEDFMVRLDKLRLGDPFGIWCRSARVAARKASHGRGWLVSHEELPRFRNGARPRPIPKHVRG